MSRIQPLPTPPRHCHAGVSYRVFLPGLLPSLVSLLLDFLLSAHSQHSSHSNPVKCVTAPVTPLSKLSNDSEFSQRSPHTLQCRARSCPYEPHPSHSSPLAVLLREHTRHTPAFGLCTWCFLHVELSCPRERMAHSLTFFKSLFKTHFLYPPEISTPPWSFLFLFSHYLFSWVLTTFPHRTYFTHILFTIRLPQLNVGSMKAGTFVLFVHFWIFNA